MTSEAVLNQQSVPRGEKPNLKREIAKACLSILLTGTATAGSLYALKSIHDYEQKGFQEDQDTRDLDTMIVDALANDRFQFTIPQTLNGHVVDFSKLSPAERVSTLHEIKEKYGEVKIAAWDKEKGYICTWEADSADLGWKLMDHRPARVLTEKQAAKYAEALGRTCSLPDDKIQKIKANLLGAATKVGMSQPNPYNRIGVDGAVVEQRVVAPDSVQFKG